MDIESTFPPAPSPTASTLSSSSSTCLVERNSGKSLPLKSREVHARVYADARFSAVEERLHFLPEQDAQVTFKFPLPPRAVVHRFEATLGTRVLRTEVKPAAQAEAEYHEAVGQGHSAAKVKQESDSSIYTVDLGNLTAREQCVVRIHYLCLLQCVAGTLEWVHTATWVPPYISPKLDAGSQEEAARAVPKFAKEVSYTLSYKVHIHSGIGVRSVESAQAIDVAEGEPGSSNHRIVTLSSDVADPARDFRLLVELMQPDKPPLGSLTMQRCQRGSHTKTVGLASLCLPRIPPGQQSQQQQQHQQKKKELVLVVDCSGSMDGTPIQHAKEAAFYFVRDLPVGAGIKFQIVLFGSRHKQMHAASQDYEAESERRAVEWISANVDANLGGTEIFQTLKMVYDTPIPEGYERQVVFLTDGGASDDKFIEELLRKHDQAARTTVLCLGIGYGVHRELVDMMAAVTGGLSQYVSSAQDIVRTCSFLKKCALSEDVLLQPRLKSKLCMLRSAPAVLPPRLFAGEPLLVLTEVVKAEEGAALELQAVRSSGKEVCVSVPIPGPSEDWARTAARAEVETSVAQLEGDAIATLHAMAYINSLLSGKSALHIKPDGTRCKDPKLQEAVKEQVVKLATEEGLVTPYTSAVGVLLQADPKDPSKTQQTEVPLAFPEGCTLWSGGATPEDDPVEGMMGSRARRLCMMAGSSAAPPAMFMAPVKRCSTSRPSSSVGAAPPTAAPPPPTAASIRRGGGFGSAFGATFGRLFGSSPSASARAAAPLSSARAAKPSWGDASSESDGLVLKSCGGLVDQGPPAMPAPMSSSPADPRLCTTWSGYVPPLPNPGSLPLAASAGVSAAPPPAGPRTACFSAGSVREQCGQAAAAPPPPPPQRAPMSASAVPAPAAAPAAAPRARPSTPVELLSSLNLSRTIEGYWQTRDSLLEDLQAQRAAREGGKEVKVLVAQVKAAKPAVLTEDVWTTVLVLAYLRQHLPQQRSQWEGMEAKALTWLQAHWPKGGVQSVGSCVLSAMKLV